MSDVAPSTVPVQQEAGQFNNPVSESSYSALGGPINYLLRVQLPVGSIIPSMLNEPQFLALLDNPSPSTWVLADGRNVAGSIYEFVTGFSSLPDLRGIFVRGANNGGSAQGTRSPTTGNPDGNQVPGTYQSDKLGSHVHPVPNVAVTNDSAVTNFRGGVPDRLATTLNTGAAGSNETAPRNATVNYFIRIN